MKQVTFRDRLNTEQVCIGNATDLYSGGGYAVRISAWQPIIRGFSFFYGLLRFSGRMSAKYT
jgi:hypothetical protein